jgi:hypothetical protein
MNVSFNCARQMADGRPHAWRHVGRRFADVNVVNRGPQDGGGVMGRHKTSINVYDSEFQFPLISSNFAQPLKRIGATFHRPQSTA